MNIISIAQRIELLRQYHLLPRDIECPDQVAGCEPYSNLLPLLIQLWKGALRNSRARGQLPSARHMVSWLEELVAGDAELSWGVPRESCQRVNDWIGPRLILWPQGIPQGRWVGIVSSRLGRDLENYHPWFAALRRTCELLALDHATMITATKTTTCAYLERCSSLYQLPLLRFELPGAKQTFVRWLECRRKRPLPAQDAASRIWTAWISPALSARPDCKLPLRDRLVTAASDQLIVLRMRRKGHIENLVRQRLQENFKGRPASLSVAVGPDLVPESLLPTLPGAKRLVLDYAPIGNERVTPKRLVATPGPISSSQQFLDTGYLTHCTRRTAGPWPDQTAGDYHDSLILDRPDTDRSALATLARIASHGKLLATGAAIRGGIRVVCFTAVALNEIKNLRTFRGHRGRWDFEPYGICIRQKWLEQRGARQVRYGDASLWNELTDDERPFFQKNQGSTRNSIDWSVEREWRHVGDVTLDQLPADAAVLFVPTYDEARWLSPQSIWPIVVLDS